MTSTTKLNAHARSFVIALVMLWMAPAPAQSQSAPDASSGLRSSTDGLFLHARMGGHGLDANDLADDTGSGIGLRLGYGFSDLFTLYGGIELAVMNGGEGFAGFEDDKYGMVLIEVGSRFHFRRGKQFVPFADAALSVVGLGYEGDGIHQNKDVVYSGAGVSMGGGLLYFISPILAIEAGASFTPGSLMELSIDGSTSDVNVGMKGIRMMLGVSVYPFR